VTREKRYPRHRRQERAGGRSHAASMAVSFRISHPKQRRRASHSHEEKKKKVPPRQKKEETFSWKVLKRSLRLRRRDGGKCWKRFQPNSQEPENRKVFLWQRTKKRREEKNPAGARHPRKSNYKGEKSSSKEKRIEDAGVTAQEKRRAQKQVILT